MLCDARLQARGPRVVGSGNLWAMRVALSWRFRASETQERHARWRTGKRPSPTEDVRGVWGAGGFLDATRDEATPSMQRVQRKSAACAIRQRVTWRTCIRRACHQGRRR